MLFSTRNFFHFCIKGKEERILPTYIIIQDDDINFFNDGNVKIMKEIENLILSNLAEIEKKTEGKNGGGYTLLPSSETICAVCSTAPRASASSYIMLKQIDDFNNVSPPMATFTLSLWVCPLAKLSILHALTIDAI